MSALPSAPFWMVYGVGQGAPTARHETADIALDEAKRLARKMQGTTFVVLEAISAVVRDDLKTVVFRAPRSDVSATADDDEIPF